MIGERFARHLKPVPPRMMPRLNLFTRYIGTKIKDGTNRASHVTPNGYGCRVMTQIIKLAGLDIILSKDNDNSQLSSYLISILKDLEKPIDVRIGRHTPHTLFVQSKTPCFELMTPSRRQNPLYEIPLDAPYSDPQWQRIRPFRICDMSNADLKMHVHQERLIYQNRGPTHVIYSLDCFALVTKFVAFYKAQGEVTNIDQCILDYLHNEIITPTLLNDAFAIWMRNTYRQQFLSASPLESHTSTIWDVVNIDTIGSNFTGAMIDIQNLRNDLAKQSVTDLTVFSSLIMTTEGESFSSYFRDLFNTSTTPDEQPYVWVDCLKWIEWWSFILTIASIAPELPDVISLKRDVIRDVRFWVRMRPWQEIHSSIPYRTMIRTRLEGLHNYLSSN